MPLPAQPMRRRCSALFLACTLSACLLTACSTPRPGHADEISPREFAARGYASVEQTAISSTSLNWVVSGQPIKIALSMPEHADHAPLVLYLPGLGESSEAGEKWREAWAAAGYAVMSVQALSEDANAWSSDLALEGDFRSLGKQRYAAPAMAERLRLLDQVLSEARRRASAGDLSLQHVAWDRVAIAGFDLGAYTTMAVAGERITGADQPITSVNVRAAIALSPFASFSHGSLDTRYKNIHLPALSITSDADRDALGLVDGPFLRTAAFNQMQGTDKYLLSLRGLPHAAFSGSAHAVGPRPERSEARPTYDAGTDDLGGAEQPGQRSRGGKRSSGGGEPFAGGRERTAANAPLSANGLELGRTAIQHVSTAFLDAYVKDDPLAREWLIANAQRWMGRTGELRHH